MSDCGFVEGERQGAVLVRSDACMNRWREGITGGGQKMACPKRISRKPQLHAYAVAGCRTASAQIHDYARDRDYWPIGEGRIHSQMRSRSDRKSEASNRKYLRPPSR